MTKLLIKMTCTVFLATTIFAGAISKPSDSIRFYNDSGKKVQIIQLKDWSNQTVEVKIVDNKGIAIWKDQIDTERISAIKYNFKELPNGKYSIYIYDEMRMVIQPFSIFEASLEWNEVLKREVFQPVLKLDLNTLDVNLLLLGNSSRLKIVDSKYRTLYSEKFESSEQIAKRFDLRNLEKGKYSLIVNTQGEQFTKPFWVR